MKQSLILQDYQIIAQALDVAARRGAFGAAEMAAVGTLHQKVIQIIQQEQPKTPESPESPKQPKEPYIKD
tara:strand:+ start:215 stop:424 length:210 start_codon:yes stop_codon:yes gene_type:complete